MNYYSIDNKIHYYYILYDIILKHFSFNYEYISQ